MSPPFDGEKKKAKYKGCKIGGVLSTAVEYDRQRYQALAPHSILDDEVLDLLLFIAPVFPRVISRRGAANDYGLGFRQRH